MATVICPECNKENNAYEVHCVYCGAMLMSILSTHRLPDEDLETAKQSIRWGHLPFHHGNAVKLHIPHQHKIIPITMQEGEQILLGRIDKAKTKKATPQKTLEIPAAELKARLAAPRSQDPTVKTLENAPEEEPRLIDLDPYDAEKMGVSRRHAVLTRSNNLLAITPLKTTNGTRLNGIVLRPNQRRVIRDGDELQLGALAVHFEFQTGM